jgi:hypothetical protein
MLSPHPSYPTLEMAAASRPVVTTAFKGKSATGLAAVSPNIIAVEPNVEAMVAGLQTAVKMEGDELSAGITYPSSWRESFATIIPRLLQDVNKRAGT